MGLLIVASAVVLVLGLGITLWVVVPAFQGPKAARRDLGTHRLAIGSWVAVIVLNVLISFPLAPLLHLESGLTTGTFLVVALSTDMPMLLVVYVRLIMPGAVTLEELGLRRLPLDYALRMGLAAGLTGLVVIDVVGSLLSQVGLRPNQLDQFQFVLNEGPLAFVLLLIAAAVVAPFVEELFFRGFLFGIYRRRQPLWVAYVASSVLFTVLHLEPTRMSAAQMAGLSVGIFILAIVLDWLYQHTGSVYPGMVAHAVNNATGLILFYTIGIH